MKVKAIKRHFDAFCEECDVYSCNDIGYVFTKEEDYFNHIQFLFGNPAYSSSSKVKAFHCIMDHIYNINKKYFKSEIRRTFKVNFYKKWIDRYDKRAIILNNEDETVLWYNKIKMKKTLKIVATNDLSRHLHDKIASYEIISVEAGSNPCVSQLIIDDQSYLFNGKRVSIHEGHCIIEGMISDDKSFVASIALEFQPE